MLRFRTAPFAIPFELAQTVAAHLGVAPGHLPLIHHHGETWLYHFWGDVYGALLAAFLSVHYPLDDGFGPIEAASELCLRLPFRLDGLPPWDEATADDETRRLAGRLEPYLELGRFQPLLPPALGLATVVEHCDLGRLGRLYQGASLQEATGALRPTLLALV